MATSLGQAIALQGRNQVTEQLGKAAFQLGEADKNRKLKLQVTEGAAKQKAAKELDDATWELFKDKTGYHPLVQPKVKETLEALMNEIKKDKESGNPYASNRRMELLQNARLQLGEYKTVSDNFHAFDKQIKILGKGNYFVDPTLRDFINNYYTKSKDYLDLADKLNKNNFQFGGGLNLTDVGTIEYNPEMKINYTKDIVDLSKRLKTIRGEDMRSLPYDTKELKQINVIPYSRSDAENAMKNNPTVHTTQPISVEDVVEDYMDRNPLAVDQFVRTANLKVQKDPELQDYTPTDKESIKQEMMKIALPYTNPEVKSKMLKESKGITVNAGDQLLSPVGPTVGLQEDQIGNTAKGLLKSTSVAKWQVPIDNFRWQANQNTYDAQNNAVVGALGGPNMKLDEIAVFPYVKDLGRNGIKRFVSTEDYKKVLGVMPFVKFSDGSNTYYVPLKDVSTNEWVKSKYDGRIIENNFNRINAASDKVNQAMKSKTFASADELYKFIEDNYKQNYGK